MTAKSPTWSPQQPATIRERQVIVVDDDQDARRTLEVSLDTEGVSFLVSERAPDGTDRSFSAHVSRVDFLAIMEHLRRHETVLR